MQRVAIEKLSWRRAEGSGGPYRNRTYNQWIKSPLLYLIELTALLSFSSFLENGVDDGTRTHDDRVHNPGLYQLSYAHHNSTNFNPLIGAPGRTRTCNPRLSLPLLLSQPRKDFKVCGLDYLFTVSGAARIVSTEP